MKTVFAKKALLTDGWTDNVRLSVAGGRIQAIEAGATATSGDAVAGYVIPGLCNAHSHAFQRALAGHTEQRSPAQHDNFWTWRERMYELANVVDADALTAIATQVYTEMLASGYTTVAEFHYLHRDPQNPDATDTMFDAITAAAATSGIRLTYVPVHYERAGFNDPDPAPHQQSFAMTLDEFLAHQQRAASQTSAAFSVGIGAHSLRAVSQESLQAIAALANDSFVPMHIHVAEQQREVDQCMSAYGRRPVRWLLENFEVGGNWTLVHATHMDQEEVAALAKSDAVVALCPSTEANLGDGLFPLHDYLSHDGRIAIGSDSHVSINPFEELRWLEYGQRLATQTRNVASLQDTHVGRELFMRALEGGAAASGRQTRGLQQGAVADLVVLGDDDPMLAGHSDDSRLDALVFSGYPLPLEQVMVNGEWVVVAGQHVHRDESRAAYIKTIKRLGETHA
ncbi:MAG: formimidoylglutamate deiminase [Gammaproteobacteria bacterium]|nr:formimidoylglutamate deiminase [Gammaproteobacteria bacterium]